MRKKSMKKRHDPLKVRGFLRGQIKNPDGSVVGDTGWIKNSAVNYGLTNYANLIAGNAGVTVGYAALGTQTSAINATQTTVLGTGNAFQSVATSTSGTCTATFTCSFAGSNGALNVGVAGLYKTNSDGSLLHAQTFASSAMATNQNFNLTYQIRFATA